MTAEPGISQASVQSVRKDLKRRTFPAGATIFAEGDTESAAYILLPGDATIFLGFGTPHQRMVNTLKPGQMFGIHALMAGANGAATAVTAQRCDVLAVSEAKLKQKLDEADPFLRYWVDQATSFTGLTSSRSQMKSKTATILASAAISAGLVCSPEVSHTDGSGMSVWLLGLSGTLAGNARLVRCNDLLSHDGRCIRCRSRGARIPGGNMFPNSECEPEFERAR